ncbi:RecBCD enzyme subunit RecC [Rhodoferax lithotrophicus]|uniref:RecBCD enzyme subunit RecC n=2 Tax=Rhodoferax lithotrophicus TaxID=2798804 RepID=A0ABN6D9J7_9BURK|nr:RecBCD enzyme subunit RecC [Rhodoferax sp. MIZ03]
MVLHGNRLEDLRDLLTQVLQANPLRPLEPEVILLQSNGMKHWLELALADDAALGICAATRMELPGGYLWQLYRAVLGADAVPAHMPFDKTSLLWRLVRLLPALCDSQPVYAPLKRYLSGSNPARKLYQLAVQVADVIDGYQSYRADWLADWADGQDQLRDEKGQAQPLLDDHAWQAQLWRDIRADVGEALMEASRASVHARFMAALEDLKNSQNESALRRCGLPRRLIVFGISSLPMQTVQALAGLGQHCQVLMLVQNPCQYFWGDLVEGHDRLRQQVRRRQQLKPMDTATATHPLLASWGKQGRDYLHLLDGFDQPEQYRAHWSRVDVFVDPAADGEQPTQLAQLQSAMLNLSPTPPEPQPQPDDGSLVFVTAHSAQRELEVLHDRLLAWLDADPSLLPRDVMVMVPDMPAFAPHIHAVFGRFRPGQPRFIPFSVADTTARTSPLVQALEQLLNLPTSRLSLADWLGLFEVAAVRQRFKLDEAGVDQIQTWLAAAGVRWGLDAAHRIQWGLPATAEGLAQNTWAFGLRRLLLGYALGSGAGDEPVALWQDTLAQPALSSLDAPLAAGLLDWLDAVEQTLPSLQQDQTPVQWGTTLQALVSRFFAPADDADERALARLLEPLEAWLQACADAQLTTALPLEVVREHWLAQMQDSGLQQRFFGGGVQFGTLMPMRSIPFKVIALLGMNDGAYPRVQAARDFDLMASSWRAGDRSRREDDRYLFLEAILSARQTLYVSWQGHSASDNSPRPPSVLVAQLLDYVNTCWTPHREPQAQPLQPFSSVYFEAGSGFATYDADWERIQPVAQVEPAQAAIENRVNLVVPVSTLTLADLQRLLRQPVEVFFRNRLQLEFDSLDELDQTDEPFALNALQQHNAGVALLQSPSGAQALQQLHGAGQLPLAGFGQQLAQQLLAKAEHVRSAQALWLQSYPQPLAAQPVDLTLDGGINLSGTLANLWGQPDATGTPSSPCLQLAARTGAVLQGSKNATAARGHVLVNLWVNHLGACASGLALTSVQLGVDGQVVIRPIAQDEALATLNRLAQAYASAWASPLPVACQTAWAYLQAEKQNLLLAQAGKPAKDPHEAAEDTFEGGQYGGELAQSAYLQRAFERYADLAAGLPHWAQAIYGDLADSVDVSQEVLS